MAYKPNWPSEKIKELVDSIEPEQMKKDFEEYGFEVELNDSNEEEPAN